MSIADCGLRIADWKSKNPRSEIRNPRWNLIFVFAGLMLMAGPALVQACPSCKEALFDPAQAERVTRTAKGYAWSIGLLIGTPALLVGTLATIITHRARRHRTPPEQESELTP